MTRCRRPRAFSRPKVQPWPAVDDPGGTIAERYGVTGPPTTFLVDPSGRITVEPETGPATQAELQDMIDQGAQTGAPFGRSRRWLTLGGGCASGAPIAVGAHRHPLVIVAVALAIGSGVFSGKPETAAQRAARIEAVVRCPSCVDVSVAQSQETTALAVRHEIERQVGAGRLHRAN